jgi:tetratricopeptide (TPR) repeat protein
LTLNSIELRRYRKYSIELGVSLVKNLESHSRGDGKSSALAKYRGGLFLLAIAVLAFLITYYVAKGSQPGQKSQIGETPTGPVASPAFTSPVSPLTFSSPVPTNSIVIRDLNLIQSTAESGVSLYESGNYTEALKAFNSVIDMSPDDPMPYDMRGTIYTALNDYEHALNDYDKAIALDPTFAQAFYNRGRVYGFLKKYDEALSDLQQSIKFDAARFGYRANGNIGLIYHEQGQYQKALNAFAVSVAYDSTKPDVFYLRGETYTAFGKYDAAITDYQSAISRFPQYDSAYQGLGYAYYKLGQYDKAIEALNHAVEISPNSPAAHLYLALVYLAQNDASRAKTEVSQGAKTFTTFTALSQEDRQLIYTRVTADLKAFAQKNPDKAADVESMVKQIPAP